MMLFAPRLFIDRVRPSDADALVAIHGEAFARPWSADDFVLAPGSQLLLYTDGVSEARNADGAFYDPAARLRGRCFPSPGALLDGLLTDVERHTDGRTSDDMALLAVARG